MPKRIEKYWLVRLFLLLFSLSVSVAVMPCGIVNVHGLFGEITSAVIVEEQEQVSDDIGFKHSEKVQKAKGVNVIYIWFELLVSIACICAVTYMIRLPRGDTIVLLKVRMDD